MSILLPNKYPIASINIEGVEIALAAFQQILIVEGSISTLIQERLKRTLKSAFANTQNSSFPACNISFIEHLTSLSTLGLKANRIKEQIVI